jgi:uncharacterized protein (DUF58 family)
VSTLYLTKTFGITRRWGAFYDRWLRRRLPPSDRIILEQRRLFIFPTRRGFFFMLTLLVMLLTAINYQNNLVYGLTFWLSMVFIVTVHFTHGNLMGLVLQRRGGLPVFAGQQAEFVIRLVSGKGQGHRSVRVSWEGSDVFSDVLGEQPVDVSLFQSAGQRGWHYPGRIKVESTYPLGLLRCWTFVDLGLRTLVWPKPLPCTLDHTSRLEQPVGAIGHGPGDDDLSGFRPYQMGDSLRSIDWRAYAREQGLLTRQFHSPVSDHRWLDWSFVEGDCERRLSCLCFLVLEYHERGDEYGLRLPEYQLDIAGGDRHREHALRALALYGLETTETER